MATSTAAAHDSQRPPVAAHLLLSPDKAVEAWRVRNHASTPLPAAIASMKSEEAVLFLWHQVQTLQTQLHMLLEAQQQQQQQSQPHVQEHFPPLTTQSTVVVTPAHQASLPTIFLTPPDVDGKTGAVQVILNPESRSLYDDEDGDNAQTSKTPMASPSRPLRTDEAKHILASDEQGEVAHPCDSSNLSDYSDVFDSMTSADRWSRQSSDRQSLDSIYEKVKSMSVSDETDDDRCRTPSSPSGRMCPVPVVSTPVSNMQTPEPVRNLALMSPRRIVDADAVRQTTLPNVRAVPSARMEKNFFQTTFANASSTWQRVNSPYSDEGDQLTPMYSDVPMFDLTGDHGVVEDRVSPDNSASGKNQPSSSYLSGLSADSLQQLQRNRLGLNNMSGDSRRAPSPSNVPSQTTVGHQQHIISSGHRHV